MAKKCLLVPVDSNLEVQKGEKVVQLPMATKITKPDGTVTYDNSKPTFVDIIVIENWEQLIQEGHPVEFRFAPVVVEINKVKVRTKYFDTVEEMQAFIKSIEDALNA